MIHNLKTKIKDLWTKARYKLIEVLGGYAFSPVAPEIKAERVDTVKVSASLMVNKDKYDNDIGYRTYVIQDITRLLADQILSQGVSSSKTVMELNDYEYIVKVSATLVKGVR